MVNFYSDYEYETEEYLKEQLEICQKQYDINKYIVEQLDEISDTMITVLIISKSELDKATKKYEDWKKKQPKIFNTANVTTVLCDEE